MLIAHYDVGRLHVRIHLNLVRLAFQVLFPLRNLLYPGELFWNEQGYRFSWRVMLMEKKGNTTFKIKDSVSGNYFYVNNEDFLTPFQEKQMSFQQCNRKSHTTDKR